MLVTNLGIAAVPGLLVLASLTPISQHIVHIMAKTQGEVMRATDKRMAVSAEVLNSIKHVKLMAHENPYREKILHAREIELAALRKNQLAKALLETFSLIGPAFTLLVSLFWYTKVQGREISAAVAFSSVIVTEMLRRSSEVSYPIRFCVACC
jgi:ABC-type bacteriocin/lantibiotic exporter with double-glycine peptidase domain